jgi:hypothetical protein
MSIPRLILQSHGPADEEPERREYAVVAGLFDHDFGLGVECG